MTSDSIRERGRSQRLSRKKNPGVVPSGTTNLAMAAGKAGKQPPTPKKPIEEMPEFWQRLKAHIDEREAETNESLNSMSERAGLSSSYISNMVTQRKIPRVDAFLQVCDAVEANPAYILWGVDMTPEQAHWAKMLEESTPHTRAIALMLLESPPAPSPDDDSAD